jgi:cysteine desulfurase family protein
MAVSRRIYFDNSATTFPKPPEVLAAMMDYATRIGASAGRGAYAEAQESARVIRTCRERLCKLFNGENPDHFIFTLNCTDALNMAIQGTLRAGDHAICTWMDHNSVLRPYNALSENAGVACTHIRAESKTCLVDPNDIRKAITPKTKLIASVHVSNVTGAMQHIREIGKIAREAGIPFLVDAAQSAGHVPIDVQADFIDLLAAPGHKGLLGALGTGFLYIRPGLEKKMRSLRYGGTGSVSENDVQPEFMPDKFESGSHNAIGIAGLSEGIAWILKRGIDTIYQHDKALCATFIEAVDNCEGLSFFGPQGVKDRAGVFSVRVEGVDPHLLAKRLENEFGILTRAGLHCAPRAHQTIGTSPADAQGFVGTTRLSFGPFLTTGEVQYAADALASIALERFAAAK